MTKVDAGERMAMMVVPGSTGRKGRARMQIDLVEDGVADVSDGATAHAFRVTYTMYGEDACVDAAFALVGTYEAAVQMPPAMKKQVERAIAVAEAERLEMAVDGEP